ncbi:hypothetical protein KI387_012357, partial [Taxus chinensis]
VILSEEMRRKSSRESSTSGNDLPGKLEATEDRGKPWKIKRSGKVKFENKT